MFEAFFIYLDIGFYYFLFILSPNPFMPDISHNAAAEDSVPCVLYIHGDIGTVVRDKFHSIMSTVRPGSD